jgi:hypothetical protein
MEFNKIIWLIHLGRIRMVNLIVNVHNFLVRYRLSFLVLIVSAFFFTHNLVASLSLLAVSFLIYIGPNYTNRWINSLKEKIETNNRLDQEYYRLWEEISTAENEEKHEAVLKKIAELNDKDADLKLSLKIMVLSKLTAFILATVILALAAFGTGVLISRFF